jgi:dTDP-4-dehydrorhamnose 3,5-epimerase
VTFRETSVKGIYVIELERVEDERGFFARSCCTSEFAARGLNPEINQCSISFNHRKGTLRGLHYQEAPFEEAKLIRCSRGAIFDVALDLRPDSPTYLAHFSIVLDSSRYNMLYIPEGCAHGFQTLEDNSEAYYQISQAYAPEFARGVRWDDPAFDIAWPLPPSAMSLRDRSYPDFRTPVAVRKSERYQHD